MKNDIILEFIEEWIVIYQNCVYYYTQFYYYTQNRTFYNVLYSVGSDFSQNVTSFSQTGSDSSGARRSLLPTYIWYFPISHYNESNLIFNNGEYVLINFE